MKFKELKKNSPKGKENKIKRKVFQKIKKRTLIVGLSLVSVIVIATAGVIIYLGFSKENNRPGFSFGNMQSAGMQFNMTDDMVAASGVTGVGVTEESFDVENLSTGLKIEEVYVSSKETITEGTKVLKLSADSIEAAREELNKALKDADLAYRAGVIEYEQSKITAEYDKDSTILNGKHAKAVYDETISGLTTSVEKAKEELEQAKTDIAEYQSYVKNDSYRSYYRVDEYQAIYDNTLEALIEKMDEWNVSWPQVTGQGGSSFNGVMPVSTVSGGDAVYSPSNDQIQVLASLYDVLELQRKDLDQAENDYQEALKNAAFELQTLELQLPELENNLAEAEINYRNQILQAELTYQTSLTNAQSADSDYETAIEQAETIYKSLKRDWEDAKDNLELFEELVGDGYFYASGNGTILRMMARAGQNVTSESTIFMYSNPEKMTVNVSVDQVDIASIELDESVYIQSSEYGGFEGIVTQINPISNSESRTNVTYSVTVQFSGNESGIGTNESVSVIFGMDSKMIQSMISMTQGRTPQGGQMPEGFNFDQMPGKNESGKGNRY